MISAYKIGIEIALTGNIGKIINDLVKQFEAVNSAIKRVQDSVSGLQGGMEKLGQAGRDAAAAWREAASAMERAAKANPGMRGGSASGAGSSMLRIGAAAAGGAAGGGGGGLMLGRPGGAAGALRLSGPGGGGRGGGGGGWGGDAPFLNPGAGFGAGAAAGAAMSGHDFALAGMGYGALASGIYEGEKKAIDAASEISHLRAMLLAQGVKASSIDAALDKSRTIARSNPGITQAQSAEALIDLKSVLGGTASDPASLGPALAALPAFAQTMSLLNAIGKQKGDPTFAAAKAQELLGHLIDEKTGGVSSQELQKHLDAMGQVAVATNNRVGPTDYLATVKQARLAGILADDQFLYKDMPALMMEMGGSRAGTGMAAFSRQFMAGTMTKQKYLALRQLGLYDSSSSWKGGHVNDSSEHLKNEDMASKNPAQWVWETLIPAMEKHGIKDRLEQAKYVAQIASTAVGTGFLSSLIVQEPSIKKESANIGAAQTGGKALDTMYNQDFTLQLTNFQAAIHNFATDIGGPLIEPAGNALHVLTVSLNALGQWAHDNPDVARRIGEWAAGVGLFAAGTAAVSGIMFLGGPMIKTLNVFFKVLSKLAGIGPALPAVEAGLEGTATGLSALASVGGLAALGGALASAAAGILAIMAVLKVGSDHETPETPKQREDLRRGMGNGLKPDVGDGLSPGFAPPAAKDGTGKRSGDIYLDGRKVGVIIDGYNADRLSKPPTGGNSPDYRISPLMPGVAFG